jgi:hypothetical protein
MAKGKAKVNYLGRSGVVMPQTTPSWDYIYETSTVKHPKYEIGDRVVLPDGREFHYAKSSAACISGQGCEFTATGIIGAGYPAATVAKGGKAVTLANSGSTTVLTHAAAYAKDEFRGAYVVFYDVAAGNADTQFRGVIGNDASAINAVVTVYLDGQLHKAVISNTFTEVFDNPYAALQTSAVDTLPVAGVPAVEVSAANMYFWVQKAGPCWVAPQGTVIGNQGKGCFWRHDGSLQDFETVCAGLTVPAGDTSQYAGHLIEADYAGTGPLFMLQG